MIAETSSTDPGKTTARASFPSTTYGEAPGPVTMWSALTKSLKRWTNAPSESMASSVPEHRIQRFALHRRTDLSTWRGRREDLPGVHEPIGVKDPLHLPHRLQVVVAEHQRHKVPLLEADSMFPGEAAAHLDAGLDDLRAHLFCSAQIPFVCGVVEDERVKVPVAGVEDVGHAKAVFLGKLSDEFHDRGKLCPRDHRVLHVIIGADLPHGGEGGFPSLPE